MSSIQCLTLVDTILFFSQKGWVPATSSNFSFRKNANTIVISRSGVDKSKFSSLDLIEIDYEGTVKSSKGEKSSAETLIHTTLYKRFPEANCVLHTHSVNGTSLSRIFGEGKSVIFKDYEVLKAFEGIKTHETETELPVLKNTQDMHEFSEWLNTYLDSNDSIFGFLIEGHGLYTWATTIEAAKRYIEAFEFLMECELIESRMR